MVSTRLDSSAHPPESKPPATHDMPMTAPTMEWVVDTGSSRNVASSSQMPAASNAHNMPYLQAWPGRQAGQGHISSSSGGTVLPVPTKSHALLFGMTTQVRGKQPGVRATARSPTAHMYRSGLLL